jgi:hypothetical protein
MKPIVSTTPEDIGSPEVLFDNKAFNDFVSNKGYEAYIDRAIECPCKVKSLGSALSTCVNCNGTGWIFVNRSQTKVACTGISNRNKYENWTKENMGTISITSRPIDKLGFMDRITLLELEAWFTEVLKPVVFNSQVYAFTIYPVIEIMNIYKFNGDNAVLQKLAVDTDYTISGNKIVFNYNTYGATQDFSVSVRYKHNPVYHVIDINRDLVKQYSLNQNGTVEKQDFPLNAIGRKAHYMLDAADLSADSVLENT